MAKPLSQHAIDQLRAVAVGGSRYVRYKTAAALAAKGLVLVKAKHSRTGIRRVRSFTAKLTPAGRALLHSIDESAPKPIMDECDHCGGNGEVQQDCENCGVGLTKAKL